MEEVSEHPRGCFHREGERQKSREEEASQVETGGAWAGQAGVGE